MTESLSNFMVAVQDSIMASLAGESNGVKSAWAARIAVANEQIVKLEQAKAEAGADRVQAENDAAVLRGKIARLKAELDAAKEALWLQAGITLVLCPVCEKRGVRPGDAMCSDCMKARIAELEAYLTSQVCNYQYYNGDTFVRPFRDDVAKLLKENTDGQRGRASE